jgi:hypothetical protein
VLIIPPLQICGGNGGGIGFMSVPHSSHLIPGCSLITSFLEPKG